jgi:hypothetical protein
MEVYFMKLRKLICAFLLLGALQACTFPRSDLTSPCVGASGSPCDRRPVNDWWLKNADSKNQG